MSNYLNTYPVFEDNQVLTSTQLNEMVAYLDEQSRLTRANLLGTGVACGLNTKYSVLSGTGDSATVSIFIHAGGGITSQGFLTNMGECTLVKKRPYSLPPGTQYPYLTSFTGMYELLSTNAQTLSTDVVTNLTAGDCNDRIVLLFLESVDADLNSCLGKACDENGLQRVFNLRRLLVKKSDIEAIKGTSPFNTNPVPFVSKLNLPEIVMQRYFYNGAETNATTFSEFSIKIMNSLKAQFLNLEIEPPPVVSIFDRLFSALRDTYTTFQLILAKEYNGTNPFPSVLPPLWTGFLNNGISNSGSGSGIGPNYLGMQYFYDFVNDMVMAYNEFRAYANEILEECCVNADAFPRHLMLGEAMTANDNSGSSYRHYFKPSPLINGQSTKAEAAIFYHKRMVLMFNKFNFALINNPYVNSFSPSIRITPTIQNTSNLSKRAIPYYYKADEADSSLGGIKLWEKWSYNYKVKGLLTKSLKPYGYHQQSTVQSSAAKAHQTPLFYSLTPYDSFRIEGHLGKLVSDAIIDIKDIRDKFDLPFNFISLKLATAGTFDPSTLNIEDLQSDYRILREELIAILGDIKKVLVKTSTSTPSEDLPPFLKSLLEDLSLLNTNNASGNQPQTGYVGSGPSYTFNLGHFPVLLPGDSSPTYLDLTDSISPNSGSANAVSFSGPVFAGRDSIATILSNYDISVSSLKAAINDLINDVDDCLPFNLTEIEMGIPASEASPQIDGFVPFVFNAIKSANEVKAALNQLIDAISRNGKLRQVPEMLFTLSSYFNETFTMLERLIRNTQYRGIRLSYYTYLYRKNETSAGDMRLFRNFIKKHPGISHTGAVKSGGTFILLSNGTSITTGSHTINAEHVIADFSLPYMVDSSCLCNPPIPVPAFASLAIPAVSPPFYVEYCLGDYAYAQNRSFGVHNNTDLTEVFYSGYKFIDIASDLILDLDPLPFGYKLRFYLVSSDGERFPTDSSGAPGYPSGAIDEFQYSGHYWAEMETKNSCNSPKNQTVFGKAYVISDSSTELTNLKLAYRPTRGATSSETFNGVDSFYYMFEIINGSNNVVRQSNIGEIHLHVDLSSNDLTEEP